ncbi:flavodoxin-dependent (E)-4-hydroxy-3-methylbut-2-enyl-diphosphate synthase [Fusibacter ferrireducens]|uniref:4-hydroxy-3-methylbut-2-en-1-yl diphosphate synthase (flavodoxin) n=1 Tax=Fusibacter ferrireducens TaxID=2785058 RepID=A0ABR9ZMS6_9FIRM|nr:flavodoxin-dependent (E)-4-hydroxy-3-methylbut-2-enyl-diphosphate synthase [Fusibacter ferrireducens]MBF4691765.1 flavodoxin-dependent (E)-4-hydroxy-3-methylbut-2-enyl-diphosphate synthase [Fusibacter ferrireducens]
MNGTREIKVGNLFMGGSNPVLIQSMTNTKTEHVADTVKQILELEAAGCEIVRVAVPTMAAAKAIKDIKAKIHIPIVADIHFDYRLAIESIHSGVDKIRLNPGNIGDINRVAEVVTLAKAKQIPIRIGVNGGSLDPEIYKKYGGLTAEALVESAMSHVKIFEALSFYDIAISIKASDIPITVKAYRLLSEKVNYPLHLGITEAGTKFSSTVKSSIGIGALLLEGIGDTIRVTMTDDPVEEIQVAKKILEVLDLRSFGIKIIACPTCGRTEVDLIKLAQEVEKRVENIDKNMTVAIMGCAVNGPGEAREADIGIAGGKGEYLLFKKGLVVRKIKEEQVMEALLEEIDHF